MPNKITLIAHRGYSSRAPENTLASFNLALQRGYRDIEFDVQLSKDNVPVVIHDVTVNRTTNGFGKVSKLTLLELKRLDAGSWFSSEFRGEPIPTLEEVLVQLKGKARIHIELKEKIPELPRIVADILKTTGWLDDIVNRSIKTRLAKPSVTMSSFDRTMVLSLVELLPAPVMHEILVEVVSDEGIEWASTNKLYSYHPDGNDITPELLKKAKKLNVHIGAWWWSPAEQNISKIKGAKYAFVDEPDKHHPFRKLRVILNNTTKTPTDALQ